MISRRRAARPAVFLRKRPLPLRSRLQKQSMIAGQGSDPATSHSSAAPLQKLNPTHIVVRKRLPAFWRSVDDAVCTENPATPERLRLWRLVCTALRIPSRQVGNRLMVPALYETLARKHLGEVAREKRLPPAPPLPTKHNAHLALLALAALIIWFGITRQWWFASPALSPEQWNALGALDVYHTLHGQWYRTVTALTLHSNSEHLFNNMLFGAPFFALLCRRVGVGPGMALAIVSGALGNAGNAIYRTIWHSPSFVSLGFSTALFGIVGALSGVMAAREILHLLPLLRAGHENAPRQLFLGLRRACVLLAAAVALLAMLGSDSSARTDYAAHIFGLLAGILCGFGYGCVQARISRKAEYALGAGTVCLVALSWLLSSRG